MFVPALPQADIAKHGSTGHPCVVVPYKFEPQPSGRGGGGRGRGAAADSAAGRANAQPPVAYNPQPICAVLAGTLFNDDRILSVAHQFQEATDWHRRHPTI